MIDAQQAVGDRYPSARVKKKRVVRLLHDVEVNLCVLRGEHCRKLPVLTGDQDHFECNPRNYSLPGLGRRSRYRQCVSSVQITSYNNSFFCSNVLLKTHFYVRTYVHTHVVPMMAFQNDKQAGKITLARRNETSLLVYDAQQRLSAIIPKKTSILSS